MIVILEATTKLLKGIKIGTSIGNINHRIFDRSRSRSDDKELDAFNPKSKETKDEYRARIKKQLSTLKPIKKESDEEYRERISKQLKSLT